MSSKRDHESSLDELYESARTSSIPRHLSATSISDTHSNSSLDSPGVRMLRLVVDQLKFQLLHEQQLREQSTQQFQREKQLREREQLLQAHRQRDLAEQLQREKQLREQQEQELRDLA